MSDAGKVMIGTDGNPLLSADGKIVLADDLYPGTARIIKTVNTVAWFRDSIASVPACASSNIWSKDWSAIVVSGIRISTEYLVAVTGSRVTQCVIDFSLSDYEIDWSRVKSVIATCTEASPDTYPSGLTFRVSTAQNRTGAPPADTSIRDSWTLFADYTGTLPGTIALKWDTNGANPGTLSAAMMVTADTCDITSSDIITTYRFTTGTEFLVTLIYNLAT